MNGGWIILLFTVGFLYLFFKNRSKKKLYYKNVSLVQEEVVKLKQEITCVTSSAIHDKKILKTCGTVKGISKSIISIDVKIADNEAMYEMLIEAKILGANAIVDLKMNTPTFEVSGSKWQTSQIIYTGTAVLINEENLFKC